MKTCVYTVLMGNCEALNEQPVARDSRLDFVCFTDNPALRSDSWKVVPVVPLLPGDIPRSSEFPKLCPHRVLPAHDRSLYIDNSVTLRRPPEDLLADLFDTQPHDMACFLMSEPDSVAGEFNTVLDTGFDNAALLYEQVYHYLRSGASFETRPIWGGLLMRNHHAPDVVACMEEWFAHVLRYSRQDQLSFRYVADRRQFAFTAHEINIFLSPYHEWPRARQRARRDDVASPSNLVQPFVLREAALTAKIRELESQIDRLNLALDDQQAALRQWQATQGPPAANAPAPTDGPPTSEDPMLAAALGLGGEPAMLGSLGAQLEELGLFDREWYLKRYPDVAASPLDPLVHFREFGLAELRDPNALFATLRACFRDDRRAAVCERLAQAGCDPVAYTDRLRLAYRDFAIVCHQRSGSHFLATAINSHPEVHCQGELLQLLIEPDKAYAAVCHVATGTVNGAIIMYDQWIMANVLGIVPPKVIHLLRDPRRTALSVIRNEASSRDPWYDPHRYRHVPGIPAAREPSIDAAGLAAWTAYIQHQQNEFHRSLPASRLQVTYEELCGDRDVHAIDPGVANQIVDFLGVSRRDHLVTLLRKTSAF